MSLSPVPPFTQPISTSSEEDANATFLMYNCPWANQECWKQEETLQDASCGFYAVLGSKINGVIRGAQQHIRLQAAEKLEDCLNSGRTAFKNETLQTLYRTTHYPTDTSVNLDNFLCRLKNVNYSLNQFEVQMLGEAHDLRVEVIRENIYGECLCENEKFLPHRDDDRKELVVVYKNGDQFSRCKKVSS